MSTYMFSKDHNNQVQEVASVRDQVQEVARAKDQVQEAARARGPVQEVARAREHIQGAQGQAREEGNYWLWDKSFITCCYRRGV